MSSNPQNGQSVPISSAIPGHLQPGSPAQQPPPPVTGKRKRVVPDALRRRTAVSCDRCKTRRAKCIRSSPQEVCSNCASAGVQCESTLPRKHRVYGSIESLSLRYRALDALVKGLLPGQDTQDVDNLLKIGKQRGIEMPDADEQVANPEIFENVQATPSLRKASTHSSSASHPTPQLPPGSLFGQRSSQKPREEKLIPAPHGIGHYVGPSSSLVLAIAVRKLVARTSADPKFMLSRRQRRAKQQDFLTTKTSMTMEFGKESMSGEQTTIVEQARSDPDQISTIITNEPVMRRTTMPRDFLPPRDIAETLVKAYFENVHLNYPLLNKGIFDLRWKELWSNEKELDAFNPGGLLCVCMVFVFGAQVLENQDQKQAIEIQRKYLTIVRSFTDQIVSTTSLQNVQALLLIQLYYHNVGERNASWNFLGVASRMAISLGLHREGANISFEPTERNIRKTIWWSLYIFERGLCLVLGRPSAIEESEVSISFPDEEVQSGIGLPGLTAANASLMQLASRIRQSIFKPQDFRYPTDTDEMVQNAMVYWHELQAWYDRLPAHLKITWKAANKQQQRAIRLLQMFYQHACELLGRTFLINYVHEQIDEITGQRDSELSPAEKMSPDAIRLANLCLSSAEVILRQGNLLQQEGMLNGLSWIDLYLMYYASFCLCLPLVLQIADEPQSPEVKARKALVRDGLVSMNSVPRAPSYKTFTNVAGQFASLVGALVDHEYPEEIASEVKAIEDRTYEAHPTLLQHQFPPTGYRHPSQMMPASAAPQPPLPGQHNYARHPQKQGMSYPPPIHLQQSTSLPMSASPASGVSSVNGQQLPPTANPHDWLPAYEHLPWDLLGRTPFGESIGASADWVDINAGTWDDMMVPSVIGGTFGHNGWGIGQAVWALGNDPADAVSGVNVTGVATVGSGASAGPTIAGPGVGSTARTGVGNGLRDGGFGPEA